MICMFLGKIITRYFLEEIMFNAFDVTIPLAKQMTARPVFLVGEGRHVEKE